MIRVLSVGLRVLLPSGNVVEVVGVSGPGPRTLVPCVYVNRPGDVQLSRAFLLRYGRPA